MSVIKSEIRSGVYYDSAVLMQLQRSLVRSHAASSGPEVEREVVRGTMLLRSLLWGTPLLLVPCNALGVPVAPLLLALLLWLAWRAAMPVAPR